MLKMIKRQDRGCDFSLALKGRMNRLNMIKLVKLGSMFIREISTKISELVS